MANNAIPYWGYFAGQNYLDTDPLQGQPGNEFLTALHKYDPNARFVQTTMGTDGSSPVWTLQYDHSKLPGGGLGGGNVDMNAGDYAPMNWSPNDHGESFQDVLRLNPGIGNYQGHLYDPNALSTDPVYGTVTSPNNLNTAADNRSYLDWAGPLAVGAFGLAFGGIPALYDGVFGQGAYGAGSASGLGASDPFLTGGTGAMDMTGSAGTGMPGSVPGAVDPWDVMGDPSAYGLPGGTQAAAPIVDHSIPATVGTSLRNGVFPSAGSIARSAGDLLSNPTRLFNAASGLLGGKPGGSGGGGGVGLLGGGGGGFGGEDASSIIRRFYGEDALSKLRNKARNG